ncbi:hypothetical protein EDC58_1938 [Caminibacter pacificus]|uniref:Uncharacterized protein n=1 Tax=Caminibacter pacificus TaxID=1424653 RepID=A0AAJ4RB75_9BACT|nr:hypothetical protein EDC58_1938 [Caminibacter pacificus]
MCSKIKDIAKILLSGIVGILFLYYIGISFKILKFLPIYTAIFTAVGFSLILMTILIIPFAVALSLDDCVFSFSIFLAPLLYYKIFIGIIESNILKTLYFKSLFAFFITSTIYTLFILLFFFVIENIKEENEKKSFRIREFDRNSL